MTAFLFSDRAALSNEGSDFPASASRTFLARVSDGTRLEMERMRRF